MQSCLRDRRDQRSGQDGDRTVQRPDCAAVRQTRSGTARRGRRSHAQGPPWGLASEDRVLPVTTYWRTNLTMRQIAALFGTSKSAADRIIATSRPSSPSGPGSASRETVLIVAELDRGRSRRGVGGPGARRRSRVRRRARPRPGLARRRVKSLDLYLFMKPSKH